MVILFLSNNLAAGGKERQIVEILNQLAKTSPHRYVLLLRENRVCYSLAVCPNLTLIQPPRRLTFLQFVVFQIKVIGRIHPEIVHGWEGMVTLSANALRLFSRGGFRVVDGSIQYAKKFPILSRTFLLNKLNGWLSDRVVANSRAGLAAVGRIENGRHRVLPNGFDLSQFAGYESGSRGDGILGIIMVASFTVAKDFQSLVRAATRLLGSGLIFDIHLVGDGPERAGVERSIPDQHKSRFIFTGLLPTKEVLELVGKSDIGILLSKKGHSEGMSNSIMEYMVLGKPVICTATGGNPELISDDFNGFLIAHEDTAMLAEKLKILLADENKRALMGARSRKIAYERFAIEKVAPKYLELYRSLMEG